MLIRRIHTPFARLYYVEQKQLLFPSVTTVLSIIPDPKMEELELKLGPEKWEKVSRRGANRGTCMHLYLENFFKYKKKFPFATLEDCLNFTLDISYRELVKEFTEEEITLGRNLFWNFWYDEEFFHDVDEIVSLEEFLFSIEGRFGGTTDFSFYNFKKIFKVTDFKSSTFEKEDETIPKYKMQISAYAKAYTERTGLVPDLAQILISARENDELSKFILDKDQIDHWYQQFLGHVQNWFDIYQTQIDQILSDLVANQPTPKFKVKPLF